jgi:hypothetical protein
MLYLSHTTSRCLTNIPTRFGARFRHLQRVPFQQLTCQHFNWVSNLCSNTRYRNAFSIRNIRYPKFHVGRLEDWTLKLRQHLSLQTHNFNYSEPTTIYIVVVPLLWHCAARWFKRENTSNIQTLFLRLFSIPGTCGIWA